MKNLKFGVDRANIEQDTTIYKLENLLEMNGLRDTSSGRLCSSYCSKFWSFWMAVSRSI